MFKTGLGFKFCFYANQRVARRGRSARQWLAILHRMIMI